MGLRVADRVEDWDERPVEGGYAGLSALADEEFSGVVRTGGAELYMTAGTVVGIQRGTIEDFQDGSGTAYEAPDPALPLLCIMQAADADVRAQYYTEDTPISEVDGTLSDGGFSGYLELSENVLSGDYFLVYHGGTSSAVGFVGAAERLITGDEAFETAADEVGIYKVRQVDIEPIDIPEPSDGGGVGASEGSTDGESSQDTAPPDAEPTQTSSDPTPPPEDAEVDASPTGTEQDAEPAASEQSQASAGSDTDPEQPTQSPEQSGTDRPAGGNESAPSQETRRSQEREPDTGSGGGRAAGTESPGADRSGGGRQGAGRESSATPSPSSDEPRNAVDLETRAVPSLDPERSTPPQTETPPTTPEPATGSETSAPVRDAEPAPTPETDEDPAPPETADLEEEIAEREAEIERLEAELAETREERDDLAAEVERLESEVARLQDRLDEDTDAERRLSPAEAIQATNLFVEYESKSDATLSRAKAGSATPEEVAENLRLGVHTEFESAGVAVNSEPFDEWLRSTLEFRFAEWLVGTLIFEIRDTGHDEDLADLYEAIPEIRRVEFDGIVEVEVEEEGSTATREESFDIIFRHRMGDPLIVANLNDRREPATGGMMETLVTTAERVGQSTDSLAAAALVTSSFFESEALETVSEATRSGILSRDKRTSFVNLSRKRGYHLCLVAAREGNFHLEVPEL